MAKSFIVFNSAHDGYRRANISFNRGDNVIENLSAAQIQQIANDKRLVLQNADTAKSADQTELVENGDSVDSVELVGDGSGEKLPPVIVPPEGVANVVELIKALQLRGNLELTNSGKPTTNCLEAGEEDRHISASLRDEAWDWLNANPSYQAEQESPEVDATEDEKTEVETPETESATTEASTSEGNA